MVVRAHPADSGSGKAFYLVMCARRRSPIQRRDARRHHALLAHQPGASSSRSYWDAAQLGGGPFTAVDIPKVPVAVTVFPGEIYRAPRSWAEKSFHKLIYWNEVDKGGHFAAWEQPELFAAELRAAFKSLR